MFVAVLGFALFTVLVKGSNAPTTAPADQPIARNQDASTSLLGSDPQEELLPEDAAKTDQGHARSSEVERVLGSGFKPSPEHLSPAPPLEDPPPLPPSPPPRSPAPPQPKKEETPAPPVAAKPAIEDADAVFENRLQTSEEQLRQQLHAIPELRLFSDLEIGSFREVEKIQERSARGISKDQLDFAFNLRLSKAMRQAGLKEGLPLQSGPRCQLDASAALIVQTLSKNLRSMGFVSIPAVPGIRNFVGQRAGAAAGGPPSEATQPEGLGQQKMEIFKDWCDQNRVEKFHGALATLLQMLQVEAAPTRLVLVHELDKVKSPEASAVLAQRAVVDLAPEVRQAAVAALANRPAEQYVSILIQSLRYPWPPVADHAADALRRLKPQGAVPRLVGLLDQPNPSLPVVDPNTKHRTVRELVRLNHMRNCLLCHAPSANIRDGLVRALVPTPGQPLPRLYYEGQAGNFVRADRTFLRQDFSINMEVKGAAPWPNEQRFDFITRVRTLAPEEKPDLSGKPPSYPQREAVLYALRGLTGKDAGDSSSKWHRLLGIARSKDTKSP